MRFWCALLMVVAWLMPAGMAKSADGAADVQDILFFGANHPVWIRLYAEVDDAGLVDLRAGFADRLFRSLDKDADGYLSMSEAATMPALAAFAGQTPVDDDPWSRLDVEPRDGTVAPEELAAYVSQELGSRFSITSKPKRASQAVQLFSWLDTDKDGHLSKSELADIGTVLGMRDLDDDETFNILELQPTPEMLEQLSAAETLGADAELRFVALGTPAPLGEIASQLLKRYARSDADERLTRAEIGLERSAFDRFDTNADGGLNADELVQLLQKPEPHLELRVQLPHKQPRRPSIAVVGGPLASVSDVQQERDNKLSLVLGGWAVGFVAVGTSAAVSDSVKHYKLQFRVQDQDKNGYLDEMEFARLGLSSGGFDKVDSQGDGKVFLEELAAFVEQEATVAQSRLEMSVGQEGKSLFETLDVNYDSRLSQRELREAARRLAGFDMNGDARIEASELAGRYNVTLQLGSPALFRFPTVMSAANTNMPPVLPTEIGPIWFRKMDVNRDGDVSRREFLGSAESFHKIDADGDGLIDPQEAEKAK